MNICTPLLWILLTAGPEDPEAQQLAAARERSWAGEADAAVELYRDFLEKWPENRDAWLEYARNLGWQGNHAHGLEVLEEAERRFGTDNETRHDRARLLVGGGWPRQARELIENQLLPASPQGADLHGLLALALEQSGEPELAHQHLQRARELGKGTRDTFLEEVERRVELPHHAILAPNARYYEDSDGIEIRRAGARFELDLSRRNRLAAFTFRERLELDLTASGAERSLGTSDGEPIEDRGFGLSLQHTSPTWQVGVELARVDISQPNRADGDSKNLGAFRFLLASSDLWRLELQGRRELFAVSPRAVELGIVRQGFSFHLEARPTLRAYLELETRLEELSNDVDRFELHLAPRRQWLRRQHLNLDLGLRAQIFGFSADLHQGYYSPELYQRYTATLWAYWKRSPNSGTSLVVDFGFYRDDRDATWRFGGDLAAESVWGHWRHFEGVLRLAASKNLRGASGAFDARSAELLLRGRF